MKGTPVPIPARLTVVTLGVADVARSTAFYRALGWEPSSASMPEVTFIQLNGAALGLFGRNDLATDAGIEATTPAGFTGVTCAINVNDPDEVASILAEVERAGGRIVNPSTLADWGGISGYFADPDGDLWEVVHAPMFPVGTDGRIQLP